MKQQILNLIDERIAYLAAYQWTDGKWSERVGDCEAGMQELRLLKEQIEKLEEPSVAGYSDDTPQTAIGSSLDLWGTFVHLERGPGEPDDTFRTRVCYRLGINP